MMNATILDSSLYRRFDRFYTKYASLFQVATGGFLMGVAAFLAVVAVIVFNQQANEHAQRVKEERTVHNACVRSRLFGPPLIDHLERVEARLHLGALEQMVEYPEHSGKHVAVLSYYRSTIPKKCP